MLTIYKTLLEKVINQEINAMRVVIKGHLQHVGFKTYIENKAKKMKLRGKVENLKNGDIKCLFKGDYEKLLTLLAFIKKGKPKNKRGKETKIIGLNVEYLYNNTVVKTPKEK